MIVIAAPAQGIAKQWARERGWLLKDCVLVTPRTGTYPLRGLRDVADLVLLSAWVLPPSFVNEVILTMEISP